MMVPLYNHDEANVTMVSHVIQAASHGKSVIRVLSDDTDVFVLLVGCTELDSSARYRWKGGMGQCCMDINATCVDLGEKCLNSLVYMPLVNVTQYRIHMARGKSAHSTPCSLETFQV